MMKKILGIFILIAGIVIAVTASSATFAYFEAERGVHIEVVPDDSELIDLRPIQPYAYIDSEDGILVIDISGQNDNWEEGFGIGVSPDSIYVFEHVFGVSNDLWEGTPICMTVSYSGDGAIRFFVGNYTGVGYAQLTFTVNPGELVPVGIVVDTAGIENGTLMSGNLAFHAVAGACP